VLTRKNLTKLMIIFCILLKCGTVSADHYWVLSSFRSEIPLQQLAEKIETELGLSSRQQEVVIDGVNHFRLLVPERVVDASKQRQIESLGISPWRIKLRPARSTPTITGAEIAHKAPIAVEELRLLLVGAFTDIDEALALERRLSAEVLPVRGEAKLAGGQVIHQVWVGPTTDLPAFRLRLQQLNLAVREVRIASASETAHVERSATQEFKKEAVNITQVPPPSNHYPKDFNLARLPEKRALFPIKP
jgi:hypothetical protein